VSYWLLARSRRGCYVRMTHVACALSNGGNATRNVNQLRKI